MFSIVVLLLSISGHTVINSNPGGLSGIAALSGVLIVIPGWIIQSGTEEILSRGWLMNVLVIINIVLVGLISFEAISCIVFYFLICIKFGI